MSFFDKLHKPLHTFAYDLKNSLSNKDDQNRPPQGYTEQQGGQAPPQPGQEYHDQHRFLSFAPERHGNETKWYVDGYVNTCIGDMCAMLSDFH
jgi:phospholipase D1/2